MKSIIFQSITEVKSLIGQEVAISDWICIPQSQIQAFADTTNDHQWIHLDIDRARRESPYGTTIAHGFLTVSLIPSFLKSCIQYPFVKTSINYGLNKVRFPAPVKVDSFIRGRFQILNMNEIEGGVQIEWLITIEIQGIEKPACIANMLIRLYS
jgi:acyl dehydratase